MDVSVAEAIQTVLTGLLIPGGIWAWNQLKSQQAKYDKLQAEYTASLLEQQKATAKTLSEERDRYETLLAEQKQDHRLELNNLLEKYDHAEGSYRELLAEMVASIRELSKQIDLDQRLERIENS